ncbi:hypothetical protein LP122_09595 [Moraxella bovis]|uniref:hypothetical protein n=1 Tax=Moraxella bovis TaxID=476 RepID=UPI002227E86D|nr:hypothetical protein [Moraxella bovis]UYZ68011.1 hypothetical protein LP122_09595 [Moraxella bovis]UZA27959.1 hypothetical protein LP119_03000 [Moraxella bovis]UZA37498.1 hypothetical protein LP101_10040 [Moraxella bovis]WAJ74154.1 hypothetical protein LP095_03010 [Moraxella bovis]
MPMPSVAKKLGVFEWQKGSFKGMQMDIDQLMYQAVGKNNDSNELKGFIQSQGARQSANEHLVPEQLFDDPNTTEKEVEGVSAVKAIQIAQEQGQTVYTITQENYSQIIPKLSLSSGVMTDIRDNVAVGRTVTVHEKTINYKGWKGSGYIIIDPQTGSGAYLIDGGANGAFLFGLLVGFLILGAMILGPMAWFIISRVAIILATGIIKSFTNIIKETYNTGDWRVPLACFLGGFFTAMSVYNGLTGIRFGGLAVMDRVFPNWFENFTRIFGLLNIGFALTGSYSQCYSRV